MKHIKFFTILSVSMLFLAMAGQAQSNLYSKAGVIKIKDKKAIMSGTFGKKDGIFEITLNDINKFNGHACGCGAAGFLITKQIFDMFYPEEIPNRRTMKIRISEYNMDLIDAIMFITGNRLNRGELTNTESDFVIDPSMAGDKGTTTMIFERKDNGKKIMAIIDKRILLTKDEMQTLATIKPKVGKGTATKQEISKYGKTTQAIVKKEILNLPEGAFTFTRLN